MHASNEITCRLVAFALIVTTTACATAPDTGRHVDTSKSMSWLAGCWQSADDSIEETWVMSRQGDQLFGYNVTGKDGQRVFFEMMRIDVNDAGTVFNAYPRGQGPTVFRAVSQGEATIEFANPDNDYPNRIRYTRDGDQLAAIISLEDGSNKTQWRFEPCR